MVRSAPWTQDVAYGIRLIVDIALKALSPGVNDTATAINCVDYLSVILLRLIQRRITAPALCDNKTVRVVLRGPGFTDLLDESFDPIRRNASGNVVVLIRLLGTLELLEHNTGNPERLRALRWHCNQLLKTARTNVDPPDDLSKIVSIGSRVSARLP